MATRFYLPSTGAADILPAYSASWYDTTSFSASKLKAVIAKISSAMVTKSMTDTNSTDRHFCVGMWVSDRLSPQSIAAQTIGCSIKCSEYNASANMYLHIIIRLVKADGVTFQDIISFVNDNTKAPLTANIASRYFSATSTARTAVGGDRIVIELGMGGDPTGTYYHNSSMIIGDNATNDLDAADADLEVDNPWVNFANTLTFMRRRINITHA